MTGRERETEIERERERLKNIKDRTDLESEGLKDIQNGAEQ